MRAIKSSEITPEQLYLSRRKFIKSAGALAASALLLKACGPEAADQPRDPTATPGLVAADSSLLTASSDELGDPLTGWDAITNYNNYFEFTVQKDRVARLAENLITNPWQVQVGGLVHRPQTYDLDDLRALGQQERVYRMRCVEAWSMVIPWVGFPLAALLRQVEPLSGANYVRFETLYDPEQMPGQRSGPYRWPYVEGLRLDEAMHDLTYLATGLYGQELLPQNGAPVRLVVPWKYGFKSIKSIVRIDLVAEMPVSLWMAAAPDEYGFFANVNPTVSHPRWPQATEWRIGESDRRETLFLNGYAEEVADLYRGMDLTQSY